MKKNLKQALINALHLKCPRCGLGKIFKAYLKPVASCSNCHEKLNMRTDDAAPWLTIVLVGHIVVPTAVVYEVASTWPLWVSIVLWPSIIIILSLLILPWAKSIFMAIIWATQGKN